MQRDVTHIQKGHIQKHYVLKLSSIMQSTKPIKFMILLPLSPTLQLYNSLKK